MVMARLKLTQTVVVDMWRVSQASRDDTNMARMGDVEPDGYGWSLWRRCDELWHFFFSEAWQTRWRVCWRQTFSVDSELFQRTMSDPKWLFPSSLFGSVRSHFCSLVGLLVSQRQMMRQDDDDTTTMPGNNRYKINDDCWHETKTTK
jgi:hypothetical protein